MFELRVDIEVQRNYQTNYVFRVLPSQDQVRITGVPKHPISLTLGKMLRILMYLFL